MTQAPPVTLCAIVKNEAHCVTKLLDSVRAVVQHYVIVDTGSTDDTVAVLKAWRDKHPAAHTFTVHKRPWINFGYNRTEALALARKAVPDGYTLMLDADETLIVDSDAPLPPGPDPDVYTLAIRLGGTAYSRRMLFSHAKPWAYKGVIHETAVCDGDITQRHWPHWRVHSVHAGARSLDPHTYKRDAAALQAALIDEPDNSRYVFYLAQSYFDSADWQLAQRYYTQRLSMGGWRDEIWFSLYRLAQIAHNEAQALTPQAIGGYLRAYGFDPSRAEPLYTLGVSYGRQKEYALAHLFLRRAHEVVHQGAAVVGAANGHRLFVDAEVYAWRADMEYAVACHYVGDYGTALRLNTKLDRLRDTMPEAACAQVKKNLAYAEAKMAETDAA